MNLMGASGKDARTVAEETARMAGRIIMAHRERAAPVEVKGRSNVTTAADHASEDAIIAALKREFPAFAVFAEESGGAKSGEYRWIIDPLDGTYNYSIGIPIFCTSIALLHHDQPIAAAIYDPNRDEVFSAARGEGATLNGRSIHVTSTDTLKMAAFGFDLGYHDERARNVLETTRRLWGNVQCFRTIGSAALGIAYAAAGRFDLYLHPYLYLWDFAAGWLLVEEAGGLATEYDGMPATAASTAMVFANPALHSEFLLTTAALGTLDLSLP